MTPQELEHLKSEAMEQVNLGHIDDAVSRFQTIVDNDPTAADGWINLGAAERSLGRLHLAAGHFQKGIDLLRQGGHEDRGLLATALNAFGGTLEALELTDQAARIYRESAKVDPRAPTPLASLAALLARAGHLREADRAATEYCMAAVSILAEKSNIAQVRKFQKALKEAVAVDGNELLDATREAYRRGFEETVAKLPEGVQIEAEPLTRDEQGRTVPVLANPSRPFSRVRFDAYLAETNDRWMIHDAPTYGFPEGSPAAEAAFAVSYSAGTPFPVLLCTRTAWDYFFVRIRFVNGLQPHTIARSEKEFGDWYLNGETGSFGKNGRGFFHFISDPFLIADSGLGYEIDLGLAEREAIPALFDALRALHELEPIEVVVLGDGALPLKD